MNWRGHAQLTDVATDLILEVFRFNGRLLVAGDRLVAHLGLTSARWQVLGAIALSDQPKPVAWLARDLGSNRQGVQRIINELRHDGFVDLVPNPHHRRAHLVVLTKQGSEAYQATLRLQRPWVKRLADGFSVADLDSAIRIVAAMRERLEKEDGDDAEAQG